MDVPSLEVLEAKMDGAGSSQDQWKLFVTVTEDLELDDL